MLVGVKAYLRHAREALRCLSDPALAHGLVFYSEGAAYAPYFRPVIDALADVRAGTVFYLSSDPDDRLVRAPPSHVTSFCIGAGTVRTYALNRLRASVVAMTMPDLGTFHIKRSKRVRHYAYLHHSMVSTHMVYRTGAFDHFDSMLCAGPHHADEVRQWEVARNLPRKRLFEQGYPPLDALVALARRHRAPALRAGGALNVLLAPSWGPRGLMEAHAERTVRIVLDAGHSICVRPHPRTRTHSGAVLDALRRTFGAHPRFAMDEDTTRLDALLDAHVMVSDWSGVAMEFAFGLERPVVFVDVPRKVNNPAYATIAATPLEVSYRSRVGSILSPDQLDALPAVLESLWRDAPERKATLRALRRVCFPEAGDSARRGAEILAGLAAE